MTYDLHEVLVGKGLSVDECLKIETEFTRRVDAGDDPESMLAAIDKELRKDRRDGKGYYCAHWLGDPKLSFRRSKEPFQTPETGNLSLIKSQSGENAYDVIASLGHQAARVDGTADDFADTKSGTA